MVYVTVIPGHPRASQGIPGHRASSMASHAPPGPPKSWDPRTLRTGSSSVPGKYRSIEAMRRKTPESLRGLHHPYKGGGRKKNEPLDLDISWYFMIFLENQQNWEFTKPLSSQNQREWMVWSSPISNTWHFDPPAGQSLRQALCRRILQSTIAPIQFRKAGSPSGIQLASRRWYHVGSVAEPVQRYHDGLNDSRRHDHLMGFFTGAN